jgi:hypothetical protein
VAEHPVTGVDADLSIPERMGKATLNLLDHLEEDFPGCELDTVAVVVAIRMPPGTPVPPGLEVHEDNVDEDGRFIVMENRVTIYCEDPRRWVQRGLIDEVADVVREAA